jgi:glutathione S-transferase
MVHIIGSESSTCTQRVLMVLAEKGVTDYTIYTPDFMAGEHKVCVKNHRTKNSLTVSQKTPHTDKQPFGMVPVLEDGDFRLYGKPPAKLSQHFQQPQLLIPHIESRALARYVATKYTSQGTNLIPDPTDLKATALLDQWLSVELLDWDLYANQIVEQKLFNGFVLARLAGEIR